jgi:hypothetical protein
MGVGYGASMKKLLFAFAAGAGVAYLFDPQLGVRRRADLIRKLDRSTESQPAVDAVDLIIVDERTPVAAGMS